jgi:hypothetical protein
VYITTDFFVCVIFLPMLSGFFPLLNEQMSFKEALEELQ